MKIRIGFVSNSSSTSFVITNKTNDTLTLEMFVKETRYLFNEFYKEFKCFDELLNEEIDQQIKDSIIARNKNKKDIFSIPPKTSKIAIFGDEDNDIIGRVYDYMLRNGGETKNVSWMFNEYYR